MRCSRSLFAAALVLMVPACGSEPARAPAGDGVLVLEVGGQQPSLRASLLAAGRSVEAPHRLQPMVGVGSAEQGVDRRESGSGRPSEPRHDVPGGPPGEPDLEPASEPRPAPLDPSSPWITVPLPKGETLIHVARRHLGDGRRYTELLEWNGWSDADARTLRDGQQVRIRRDQVRAPR